jgi:hypothetical protein
MRTMSTPTVIVCRGTWLWWFLAAATSSFLGGGGETAAAFGEGGGLINQTITPYMSAVSYYLMIDKENLEHRVRRWYW